MAGTSSSDVVDLTGTWIGKTEVPDLPGPDEFTVVFEKEEGKYIGTANDAMGLAVDSELENIELKDNELTFNLTIFNGTEYVEVFVTITVEGAKMAGSWETDSGDTATIELTREK
jgi:hypothetical protein